MIAPAIPSTVAELAFDTLARVARSGIWISSHVKAIRSTALCRAWGDVFAWLADRPGAFLHQAIGPCGLPADRWTARFQLRMIAATAGVGGTRCLVAPVGSQRRRSGVALANRAALCMDRGDERISLEADPIALAYEFADAHIENAEYRARTNSRLAAVFAELGIRRLGDLQPGRLLAYFERQERLGNMFGSTANAYRTAVWKFLRWLVIDRQAYDFARTLAELDAQGVNQTAIKRGKRRSASRKGGARG